jgi:hypothetical protein
MMPAARGQAFNRAELEADYGMTLDDAAYADYERQPVVIAESVAYMQ